MGFYENQLDLIAAAIANRHTKEAEEDADGSLELGQRCGVSKVTQELDQDELEDVLCR
jgi:hypothetical protein